MRSVNKFGVPYHSYTIYLSNGEFKCFDMAWEESWGDVDTQAFYRRNHTTADKPFLGYGNDEDGYYRIVKVIDDETGKRVNLKEFGELVVSYTDNYSCSV